MVIVPSIDQDLSDPKKLEELCKRFNASCSLRDSKFMTDLVSGPVASTALPIRLPNKPNRKTAFAFHKPGYPTTPYQSFLLIICTHHIVTLVDISLA